MFFKSFISWIFEISGIYIFWIFLHYITANLYARICAELTFIGFIKSIFFTHAPHCVAMRWIIFNGATMINNMWISLGIWMLKKSYYYSFLKKFS
jgi:hypothetical protein